MKKEINLSSHKKDNAALLAMARQIIANTTGNLFYPLPANPSLAQLTALADAFDDAMEAWGNAHNHGSSTQHSVLADTRAALEVGLVGISAYCTNLTPYNGTAFLSAGFNIRDVAQPVGLLGKAQNLRQIISAALPSGCVKGKWDRPTGSKQGNVKSWLVLNGLTSDVNAATQIAVVTKTSFIDLEAANRASNFYWVIPVNAAGKGAVSDVLVGYPVGPVVG